MEQVEKIEDASQEVFENDIELYLKLFCEERNIENMAEQSQSVWNAALMYIKKHVFNDKSILKSSKPLDGYVNNNYNNHHAKLNNSNCNAYDYDKVNNICDYYIYLCMLYNKEVSAIGFSLLTGIDNITISAWKNGDRKLSKTSKEIGEKIYSFREESLSNKLATANKNPVGILAILNRHYQWNMPGVRDQSQNKQALTAAELPKLGDGGTKQIAENSVNTSVSDDND